MQNKITNYINSFHGKTCQETLPNKLKMIEDYIVAHNIKDVTVGFSGDADSTLVVLLLALVQRVVDFNIHAVSILTTNKDLSNFNYSNAHKVRTSNKVLNKVNFVTLLGDREHETFDAFELSNNILQKSYHHYMYNILFTYAKKNNGITVGTTNSDELAYIGWFDLQSDMSVDLQIIADLQKHEIFNILAEYQISIEDESKLPFLDISSNEQNTCHNILSYYSYCKCNDIEPGFILETVDNIHKKNRSKYFGQTFNSIFLIDKSKFLLYKDKEYNYDIK